MRQYMAENKTDVYTSDLRVHYEGLLFNELHVLQHSDVETDTWDTHDKVWGFID